MSTQIFESSDGETYVKRYVGPGGVAIMQVTDSEGDSVNLMEEQAMEIVAALYDYFVDQRQDA